MLAEISLLLFSPTLSTQTQEKLVSDGVGEEAASVLAECLWVRREEVRSQLARDSCAISHSVLRDYDWKMKVQTRVTFLTMR